MCEIKKRIGNYARFKDCTVDALQNLLEVWGNENNLEERQNGGISIREVFEIASMLGEENVRVDGYIIYPPREDARITVDTIKVRGIDIGEVLAQTRTRSPDDVWEEGDWTCAWWD